MTPTGYCIIKSAQMNQEKLQLWTPPLPPPPSFECYILELTLGRVWCDSLDERGQS